MLIGKTFKRLVSYCISLIVCSSLIPLKAQDKTEKEPVADVSSLVTSQDIKNSSQQVPASLAQIKLTYSPVVKKVSPAIVNIYAAKLVRARNTSPFFDDPIFRHFFGDVFPQESQQPRVQNSLGSGVIVRADGIVITNYHVIKDAEEVKVILADGRDLSAEIIVTDERTDLAALKLKLKDKEKVPFVEIRDADELEVGDIVLAFGNPFGIGQTVTMGIVSGLARSQVGIEDFRSLIQTDAAVNPGNSGGPLVTLDGKVVGINTAIFSNTGGSIGIGFAIPSNLIVPIISSVDKGGKIKRVWVGVIMQSIDKEVAKALGLEKVSGVLVKSIFKESPAEKAGLEAKDVILSINEHEIKNENAFRFRIAAQNVGAKIKIKIFRNGTILEKEVTLETPPDLPDNKPLRLMGRHPLAGAVVVGLSPSVASELGIGFNEEGVVILSVPPGTPASFSGFMPGDVIMKINGNPVNSIEDITRKLSRSRRGWEIISKRGEDIRRLIVENG
jgi:serine protease Do